MKKIALGMVSVLLTSPLFGHHSFLSIYDQDSVLSVSGVVTEVWFENPHTRVYVETTQENGEKVVWESETYPRNILVRRGWNHKDLLVGDEVVLTGRQAKNGSRRMQMLTITRTSDGWKGIGFAPDSID